MSDSDSDGLALYVHTPVCTGRCGYCDFYSTVPTCSPAEEADRSLQLVRRELMLWQNAEPECFATDTLQSLFFGGGTPSLASPAVFAELIEFVRARFPQGHPEITLETQPGTCDADKVAALMHAGINRFSVGVQSFNERHLRLAGRRHTVADSRHLLGCIRQLGARLSIDLISCWPEQTLDDWEQTLHTALEYGPEHLSVYELTYHSDTPFTREMQDGQMAQQDEDVRVEMFNRTHEILTRAGFEHYEISNYALHGCRSKHNENYWRLGNYIGLGAGAHSLVAPHRYANPDDYESWKQHILRGELCRVGIDSEDVLITVLENFQMALRVTEGVRLGEFASRFGNDIRKLRPDAWNDLQQAGLIAVNGDVAVLTAQGRLQLDTVIEHLI